MASRRKRWLHKEAVREIRQHKKYPLYVFSLTGVELLKIAGISRIARDSADQLVGYQRPEVRRHIQDIVEYLDSDDVLFPNPIILALDSSVRFTKSQHFPKHNGTATGRLSILLPNGNGRKPAWVVDGQQRMIAISKSCRQDLEFPVNAFVADDLDLQRDQFLRINNSRPLPRGLITELLPQVSGPLPSKMAAARIPSRVCDLLNQQKRSPFYQLVRRASTPPGQRRKAVVADTVIVKMISKSLNSPSGCLFHYSNVASGEVDLDGIYATLTVYWRAVKQTFPDAWGLPPSQSRLMHGAGIQSMGRLMDRIMSFIDPRQRSATTIVRREVRKVSSVCRWTSGRWAEPDGPPWNQVQNLTRDINLISNLLIRTYLDTPR